MLTNDELRDHIYTINKDVINKDVINKDVINKWKNTRQITYSFNNNNFNYNFPLKYSKNIQNIDNYWHFPYKNNYICINVNLFKDNKNKEILINNS